MSAASSSNDDRHSFREACGVFAIYAPRPLENLAELIYFGLFALQHRGQESAGISVYQKNDLVTHKGMGLVSDVFNQLNLKALHGRAGIGHVRYSTTGDSNLCNAQPQESDSPIGKLALAHNGNLVNAGILRELLQDAGETFQTTNDTEVILKLIARRAGRGLQSAISGACGAIKGSYALSILMDNKLIAVRDPYGIRPLCLGKRAEDGSYIIASESCALDAVGAEFIRDVQAGEMVVIDEEGLHSIMYTERSLPSPCSFEHIYFARPDSCLDGIDVYHARYLAGRALFAQHPVEADLVIGVPDSGIPAATGYAEASGIPYATGLIKNRYIGRTFIQPTQALREQAVQLKLNPLRSMIRDKRLVVVDDSLVRGTTARRLIHLLRSSGAAEIHFRLASPAIKYPCYFGIDTAKRNDLIAARMDLEEIRQSIGADSLEYLSVEHLTEILGGSAFCLGCFTGTYPVSTDQIF